MVAREVAFPGVAGGPKVAEAAVLLEPRTARARRALAARAIFLSLGRPGRASPPRSVAAEWRGPPGGTGGPSCARL
eukprot:15449743-Alexandrium_andersonii.AAC.1